MPSALITGANRGLGLEFARQYLADGWQVYGSCRDPNSALELHIMSVMSMRTMRKYPRSKSQLFPSLLAEATFLHSRLQTPQACQYSRPSSRFRCMRVRNSLP